MYGRVYVITNTVNGKRYVGQTTQPLHKRFYDHFCQPNPHTRMGRAVKKYGRPCFKIEELAQVNTMEELDSMEIFYIKKFGTQDPKIGYNIRAGGGGRRPPDRGPMSEETKEKIRKANTGKHPTEETREKLRKSHLGNKPGNTGKKYTVGPWTSDQRKHHSEVMRGKPHPGALGEKHHRAKEIICVETQQVFPTITLARVWLRSRGLGTGVDDALKTPSRSAGGYHWTYLS